MSAVKSFFMAKKVASPVVVEEPVKPKTVAVKSRWPKNHWPSAEVLRVTGLHPSIMAYKHGPLFIIDVSYENKEIIERCRIQVEDRNGSKLSPNKNVCYVMPDGVEKWWTAVSQELLEEIDMMSWPTCIENMVGPSGVALHDTERKNRIAGVAVAALTALVETSHANAIEAGNGNFIRMSNTEVDDVYSALKCQTTALKILLKQLRGILEQKTGENI